MDDDQDIRDITGQMLAQLDYEVELAAEGVNKNPASLKLNFIKK